MDLSDVGLPPDSLLISAEAIQQRVAELAQEIEETYAGADLIVVGVLGGAATFVVDLTRAMHRPVTIDWISVSSYGSGTTSSGVLRMSKPVEVDVADRHVIIVDDILDTGLTMSWLMDDLKARDAGSIEACVLVRKPPVPHRRVDPRFVGFDIGDSFAIGYGLDHAGAYRNLRCIAALPNSHRP